VNSWKVILATMVIFGAGVITGGVLVHKTASQPPVRIPRPANAGTNAPLPTVTPAQLQRMEFLVRATRELELTVEQRDRVERIIREGQDRSRQIWESVAPDMRKELQLVRERIRVELTPEQRRRFEELMKRPVRPAVRPDGTPVPAPDRLRQNLPDVPDAAIQPRPLRRGDLPPPSDPIPVNPR
jgi:hypothetical protein